LGGRELLTCRSKDVSKIGDDLIDVFILRSEDIESGAVERINEDNSVGPLVFKKT
jgi:hypothetical protein